jgi:hypothetical protein
MAPPSSKRRRAWENGSRNDRGHAAGMQGVDQPSEAAQRRPHFGKSSGEQSRPRFAAKSLRTDGVEDAPKRTHA